MRDNASPLDITAYTPHARRTERLQLEVDVRQYLSGGGTIEFLSHRPLDYEALRRSINWDYEKVGRDFARTYS